MISLVIDLCKTAIDYVVKNKEINLVTRLRISEILLEISQILEDTANKLSKDEYPHANCSVMEKLSEHLHFSLIDYVPQDDLDQLYVKLKEASQLEKQFSIRKTPEVIPNILKISGEFKAMSIILKI